MFLSFIGGWLELIATKFDMTHYVENLFMWLCEKDLLRKVVRYALTAHSICVTKGIWILLFVITGPQFWGGLKKT
jgi:hypothetical protein